MQDKVFKYIKENSMIDEGDKVLVALSGGPDSICLLHILNSLKTKLNIEILAAHVNHCLRGENANKDEEFARKFCENLGIDFYVKRVNIDKVAKERKISTEMAGRDERYAFFNELKEKYKVKKIAIAHNANDQAETLIMRIARGTGVDGLVGIKPIRDEIYIRPILSLTRSEIEKYCLDNELNPRIDESNLEEIYSRNKIRLKAIPFLERNFNKDAINAINRLAYSAAKDVEFINDIVDEKYLGLVKKEDGIVCIEKEAFSEKEALLTRLIRKALINACGISNNFEMKHIYDIINLQKGNTGKKINLTNDVIVINEYGKIKVINKYSIDKTISDEEIKFNLNQLDDEDIKIVKGKFGKITFSLLENNGAINLKSNTNERYFSIDGVNEITIRTRKNGDTMIPFGMTGRKKIKDILINNKIPKDKRDLIPLILFNDEIVWISGIRSSNLYKIKKGNKKLLKVSYEGRESIEYDEH